MADHNISLFNLTHAPSSWPVINSGATLDVYPNETMYFQVKHNVDPGYTGSPDIAWIICHAGGPTPPGWTSPSTSISYDDTRQWLNWTTTWFWTVPSTYSGAYTLKWYGANGTPYWNYVDGYRAAYNINVLGALTCDVNSPTGSFTVTIDNQQYNTYSQSTTGTISGLSAGANCTMQDRAMTYAQFLQNPGQISWINSPTPPNLRSYPIVRGIPYVFQVKHAEKPESNALSATVTAPIIPPDTSITMGAGNYNTTDGYWTATFTGCGQIGCQYQIRIQGSSSWLINAMIGEPIMASPAAFGTGTLTNDWADQTPVGTTTIEVWVKQITGAGGDGIFYNTGVTFTVTRGVAHNESVVNSSGGYYDNITGDGAAHSVILGGLTTDWYYNITDNSDNYISTWTSSSVTNKTVTDTSITSLPSGTDVSTSTYKLYRSESSNGSSPTYTGVSYTRSLLNYSRLAFADATQSLDGTDTEFSVIVSNTTAGHSYYIYSGNNIVNTPYPSIPTSSGALTITVNETNIPNVNDQVTHILKTSSPVNGNTGEAYATGASYTVTRTGTDTETTTTTEGEYGLEIYAAGSETNKLYDTQSLTGRIMQSGRVPASGTIAASGNADQEVLGMANTDDFVVVAVPQVSGSGSTGTEAAIDGHNFTLTKATDEFNIRNNGAVANYYHYFVIKNGGA